MWPALKVTPWANGSASLRLVTSRRWSSSPPQDRDAHGRVAGTHGGPARGDGHARDVEKLRFERDAEWGGCGGGGVGRYLSAAVAVGDDEEGVRALARHGNLEAAVRARERAQRRRLHQHLRAHDGGASVAGNHDTPDGGSCLGGQRRGDEQQEGREEYDHGQRGGARATTAHHRQFFRQTVVETLSAGSVTSTVRMAPWTV